MKYEWYVEKYISGEYISRCPKGMTKDECNQLVNMTKGMDAADYKIVHKSNLKEQVD